MFILGISAFYHDSAAILLKGETILAAAQEERFTRIKHDPTFPFGSIRYCLRAANISLDDIDYIAFYDKPFVKFERLLETYLSEAPKGIKSFMMSMPVWLKEKLFLKETMSRELEKLHISLNPSSDKSQSKKFKRMIAQKFMFAEHHQSHAASAFFPTNYSDAAILTIDGVGEWTTTSIGYGCENNIKILKELRFPHSLGLLYSAFTYYMGFKVNSGEYKVMGLAPYGRPIYSDLIKNHLIDIKEDGSFKLAMEYFNYTAGLTMTSHKFHNLFGDPPRQRESVISQKEMDLAASIQAVTEEIVIKLARHAAKLTGSRNLCLAGGVALNCVGNGKILKENIFENIWIQPAAGDSGGALGAAYAVYYQELGNQRAVCSLKQDKMQGSFLGPYFTKFETEKYLNSVNACYEFISEESKLLELVTDSLANGKVVGWHHDRMEFGPRALGHRSIIGDAQSNEMQSKMNLKIKYRESFRPFAPSVLREKLSDWFELDVDSPYMLLVAPVNKNKTLNVSEDQNKLVGINKLSISRSEIPAVTHIDYTARVQTVHSETNPRFHKLISMFEQKTGCAAIVNTSFNVRGEPIVCTPEDSYRCFMSTEIDVLVIDDFILFKENQSKSNINNDWRDKYELD